MDTQLEIVGETANKSSNNSSQWFGHTVQGIISKIREIAKPGKDVDDDWNIPFERLRIRYEDFQRCGSQGEVFYGKLSSKPVAVKRVKEAALARIRHLGDLNHKNIIKFYGISEHLNYHYIIMEWCPYGTLHDHIHSGRQLSATILSNFVHQIACGVKYLHAQNIIHRDLKPSNILLTHHDILKISDFGTHIHRQFIEKLPVTSITYAGTHAYMAPEVIRSEPYSFSVDVWSYGVVLWEVMIGDEPYKNLDSSAVVWAVGNNSFTLPIPSSFPEGFRRILTGCWKAQPTERLSVDQICILLKGAIHEVEKMSKERWLPLQAEWKRDIRHELNKHLQFKADSNEDHLSQKRQALDEALEQAQKRRNKNNNIYLKLQECCMHLQREREDVARREEAVARMEANQTHEINRLKEKLALIQQELKNRSITLDCLMDSETD